LKFIRTLWFMTISMMGLYMKLDKNARQSAPLHGAK